MFTGGGESSDQDQAVSRGSRPWARADDIEWRDPANFERLYRVYSRRVYSLSMYMTGDRGKAERLTREAFVQLYRKLDTFRGESDFYTWFHRLAINVVLTQLWSQWNGGEMLLEGAGSDDEDEAGTLPPQAPSPGLRLTRALDRVNLQRTLDALPLAYKTVFVLHDVEGYEHLEISEMTGLSVGASKSRLHKARLRLRALLVKKLARQSRAGQNPVEAPGNCQQSWTRKTPPGGFSTPVDESAVETKLCRDREKELYLRTGDL